MTGAAPLKMTALRRLVYLQGPSSVAVIGVGAASAYLLVLAWSMGHTSFDVWGGLVVAPVLLVCTVPLALSASRADGDLFTLRIVMAAGFFKLVGALIRYYVIFSLYGSGDANGYHIAGAHLAPLFRQGNFAVDIGTRVVGTGFIEILTGVVYTFTGATKLGGFFVFAWLGFVGLFFFYRAFRIAFPEGDRRRYALLVFFMPSLLFWPSSIGKESWMMFALGLLSYGAARLLAGKPWGILTFALGLLGTTMVRPHVSLIAIVSVFGAYLLRRSPRPSLLGPIAKVIMLGVLAVGTLVVLSQTEEFFGVKTIDAQTTDALLTKTTGQTSQGGSEVAVVRSSSPSGIATAIVAVIFRPWPYEAGNVQALFASLEGMLLLGLVLVSLRRLAAVPRAMFRRPYVAFALVYSLLFSYAFSAIGNFGILARERVQLYPLLLVLLCVPVGFGSTREVEQPIADSRRSRVSSTPD
jgi:hypothetical protein